MPLEDEKARLIASALYEIRILLSGYLGSDSEGDASVREAAHLAYALHNDAASVMEGGDFDLQAALERIKAIKCIMPNCDLASRILRS
jgi:hypothetical protein